MSVEDSKELKKEDDHYDVRALLAIRSLSKIMKELYEDLQKEIENLYRKLDELQKKNEFLNYLKMHQIKLPQAG